MNESVQGTASSLGLRIMAEGDFITSAELLAGCQTGDQAAAEAVFGRYMQRLTLLARTRLSSRLASRTDPEDVVMSAWRSFFVGARDGRYSLRRSGDLWRLLVSITLHKLYHQARRHLADKRSPSVERPWQDVAERQPVDYREPLPEEAIALSDELEAILAKLDPLPRRVLELRLQGASLEEISVDTGRSERTVRRTIATIRSQLSDRAEEPSENE
jgi:RNA polymerase sigma factor (sigma-70 family)